MAKERVINWSNVPGIVIDRDKQSGTPVFSGTRIPVDVVTNNIHHGGTKAEIAQILENFDVTKEQINLVLRQLRKHEAMPLASPLP